MRDRAAAERALANLSADLALVFEPVQLCDIQILLTVRQPLFAAMASRHPLAQGPDRMLRLRECLTYPTAMPTSPCGVRELLSITVRRTSQRLTPGVESDSFEFLRYQALAEDSITFQIEIGLPEPGDGGGYAARKIDPRDVPPGLLYVAQLRGRILPPAASRFARQLLHAFDQRFECD